MCGRTTLTAGRDELAEFLRVDEVRTDELPRRWNVAPTQPVYGAVGLRDGRRELRSFRWGLVPSWAKDPRGGSRMINARAETLAQRPAYRAAVVWRRALLPFSGFYEWSKDSQSRTKKGRPFYFHSKTGEPLVFAGLWDVWRDAEGKKLASCAIVTTGANATVANVHNRMPVVLPEDGWDEWLGPGPLRPRRLRELLAPAPEGLLVSYEVSTDVNDVRNDAPHLAEPLYAGEPPALPLPA